MRVQCGVPGIATIAMWAAQAPKNLARSTKPLTRRKVTWKGTTLQIIRCEGTHFAFRVFSFTSGKAVCRRDVDQFSLPAFATGRRTGRFRGALRAARKDIADGVAYRLNFPPEFHGRRCMANSGRDMNA